MSIITPDMIHIRKNNIPFIYIKSFANICTRFYNKYIKFNNDEELNSTAINVWYHGLPCWIFVLYLEKVILDPITTSIILDIDRTNIQNIVEFFHSLYNHVLEKVDYNETTLQNPTVYEASEKYITDKYTEYAESKKEHCIYSGTKSLNRIYEYNPYHPRLNFIHVLYSRKRNTMMKVHASFSTDRYNIDKYNAKKEELLKKIFAQHGLPEPTLKKYTNWIESGWGLSIHDRWSLNRYELMTVYAKLVKDPKYNYEKDLNRKMDEDYDNYDLGDPYKMNKDYDEDNDKDINNSFQSNGTTNVALDEEVANFNINL